MKLEFEHPPGISHSLTKHPEVRRALKRGDMTKDAARAKPWYLRKRWCQSCPIKLSRHDAAAISAAQKILQARHDHPQDFDVFMQTRGREVGELRKQMHQFIDRCSDQLPLTRTEQTDFVRSILVEARRITATKEYQREANSINGLTKPASSHPTSAAKATLSK